jgi:peptidoglycan hydrolase-like protein with peptidoglycan-binding domain
MHTWAAVLLVSILAVGPVMAGAGTAREEPPEQRQRLTQGTLKKVQERLQAEKVYAGPLDGEMNAQMEAALRAYQAKQGIPVSGAVDDATLKNLQIDIPGGRQGDTN